MTQSIEKRIAALLDQMTLSEKIGQMCQYSVGDGNAADFLGDDLRAGRVSSVLNIVDVNVINELQRVAVEESRLGIPLLIGRDVIHGFKTILPIPLGQAAMWNPALVEKGARVAALEAAMSGVNWTFAPMVDITRDPRWGRIAESLGEEVFLASTLAAAMVKGFQTDNLSNAGSIAACAKHFAGYGAVESGRDYATTNVSENELRNVYLRPFKAAVEAGVETLMTSFSDLDGVPATGNDFLLRQVLRKEWRFEGFVVSDWDSVTQLQVHGLTSNDRESAAAAITAGVDMEMAGWAYRNHLAELQTSGDISAQLIDQAVANVLRTKFRLGLFENAQTEPDGFSTVGNAHAVSVAKDSALQSIVMLKNANAVLPLSSSALTSIAVIGPLADAPHEQMGTWMFDGDVARAITPLQAIQDLVGGFVNVTFARAMETSRSKITAEFDEAVAIAQEADACLLFVGEEAILSGEAHSRANIDLPGDQIALVQRIRATGKPVIAVVLAGRPLTLGNIIDHVDSLLFAWHPGTMGGPAIADLLFGLETPSGKLPVTFPREVGQIPIYLAQKNGGKPPTPENVVHIDDIEVRAPQTSFGMAAFHLDAGYTPLFEFGYGLSYTSFEYTNIGLSKAQLSLDDKIIVSADVVNTGSVSAVEVVQLYVRDLVGSLTRPVKELKGFKRQFLEAGQTVRVEFELHFEDLAFSTRDKQWRTEPGKFQVWVGGSSSAELCAEFCATDEGEA